jgi:hypothetical protein
MKTIGQNVGRDSLVGIQEFLVGPESAEHHVANDEERPAVAKDFHRGIQGTFGAPLGAGSLFRHIQSLTYFHLHFTSKIGRLTLDFQENFGRKDFLSGTIGGSAGQ